MAKIVLDTNIIVRAVAEKTRQGYNVYIGPITVTEFVQWANLNDRTTIVPLVRLQLES